MKIGLKSVKVNKKIKNLPFIPSQYLALPLWIVDDLIHCKRSSIVNKIVLLIGRLSIGMRAECCYLSFRKISKITKHATSSIQIAIKECRKLGYISENMKDIPEIKSLKDGTRIYRLNFLPPKGWKSPMKRNTFFEAYNITGNIEDIVLKMTEKGYENSPDIEYLIEKYRSYEKGRITRRDFEDVLFMFER